MKDSNSFHSCCMDTFPPLFYLTQHSMELIKTVHNLNEKKRHDGTYLRSKLGLIRVEDRCLRAVRIMLHFSPPWRQAGRTSGATIHALARKVIVDRGGWWKRETGVAHGLLRGKMKLRHYYR